MELSDGLPLIFWEGNMFTNNHKGPLSAFTDIHSVLTKLRRPVQSHQESRGEGH